MQDGILNPFPTDVLPSHQCTKSTNKRVKSYLSTKRFRNFNGDRGTLLLPLTRIGKRLIKIRKQ